MVGVLTPDEARQRARKALGDVAGGADPSAARNAKRGAMTVADLCREYLAATDLLTSLPRHPEGDHVIASGLTGDRYVGLPRAWERIAKRANLKGVTLHTLRHSFATTANTLGCSEPTIAVMLGHSRGTVTSRYVHVVDATLLAAADRVSGAIARAMAGNEPATVTEIGDYRRA